MKNGNQKCLPVNFFVGVIIAHTSPFVNIFLKKAFSGRLEGPLPYRKYNALNVENPSKVPKKQANRRTNQFCWGANQPHSAKNRFCLAKNQYTLAKKQLSSPKNQASLSQKSIYRHPKIGTY